MHLLRLLSTCLPAATAAWGVPSVAPNFRRLVLVRHGAVAREDNDPPVPPSAYYGGSIDVPLSAQGKAEALAAAALIASELSTEVKALWASPMRRALFGARAAGTALAAGAAEWSPPMEVETFEAFREIDRGVWGDEGSWSGLTEAEIEALAGPSALAKCALETEQGKYRGINGGEGFCDVRARTLAQRDALLPLLPLGGAAVVVSHLWVTRALVGEALCIEDPRELDIPTASVSVVDYPAEWSSAEWAAGRGEAPVVRVRGFKPAAAAV